MILINLKCTTVTWHQIAPGDKVAMKVDNRCPVFGQFTGAHFSDTNKNSYDINNIKFVLNIFTRVKHKRPG